MRIDNNFTHDVCPFCRSGDICKFGNIDYVQPVMFSTTEVDLRIRPELWVCRMCASRFSQNVIPEPLARSLYELGVGGKRWVSNSINRTKHPDIISVLGRAFGDGCMVLDIGANTGELLDFAKMNGCRTWGIDPCNSSRELLKEKGHSVFTSMNDISSSIRFDVITAFDLVEHLYDFQEFIDFCHLRLSRNGLLLILTGNIESFSARLAGINWWYYKYPEHIVFPSKTYFKSLTNFQIDTLKYTYSSLSFDSNLFIKWWSLLNGMAKSNYTAMPSIGPDHILLVLKK